MAERGIFGLVWFDGDGIVTGRYGRLVDYVAIGEPVSNSVFALIGIDQLVLKQRGERGVLLELPNVSIVIAAGATPRVNLTILWISEQDKFLMLVGRTASQSDLEVELSRQTRARLMAEAEVVAKSNELARVNAGLEQANGDLEQYASIISHDLKAPMRALRYLVEDIEMEVADPKPEAVQAKFDALKAQTRRMADMLTALLDYSSVTSKRLVAEAVDTRALADAVIASMPTRTGMKFSMAGDWPILETLRAPLDLVVRNLVDNAIKHHDRESGAITLTGSLTASTGGDFFQIAVEDDGPGIPADAHDAVLMPFRRLLAARNLEGQGMGLALVRRTVERLGGTISIMSSAPSARGTTVCVLWPTGLWDDRS